VVVVTGLRKIKNMRLPIIKNLVENNNFDEDYFLETVEVLLSLSQSKGIKHEELVVIGELISNIEGAIRVKTDIREGVSQRDALNNFMKRVTGSVKK